MSAPLTARSHEGWWIALGALCFTAALVGTGSMMWHDQCIQGTQAALRNAGGGDAAALAQEYQRTHQRDFLRLVVRYPLLLTGILGVFFAPSLMAISRRQPRAESIFMINTFCGVTIIGWIIALRMALKAKPAQ